PPRAAGCAAAWGGQWSRLAGCRAGHDQAAGCAAARRDRRRGRICTMLRWLTAGESHGRALVAIYEGLPAGVGITTADVPAALAGRQKYGHDDARPVLERASARETAARVALGELARQYLRQSFGIEVVSHVV